MPDYLDKLALDAKETVRDGYYQSLNPVSVSPISLRKAITETRKNAVITELKTASPSKGTIKTDFDVKDIVRSMQKGGAIGISVLTEPKHFNGSLRYLTKVRETVKLPILMKDITIDPIQLEAASRIGANAVLLITALFNRRYCKISLDEMITQAHSKNLEVLLETRNENEFKQATKTDADLIGINNRDLRTLKIDLHTTKKILKNHTNKNRVVVSESGIMSPADLLFLRKCGAQAFLIGSSIMMANNVEQKVKEYVTVIEKRQSEDLWIN